MYKKNWRKLSEVGKSDEEEGGFRVEVGETFIRNLILLRIEVVVEIVDEEN